MLLECLVSIEDADSALKGQLLGESSVEIISEKISTAVLEDAVDMSTLRRYFDGDAWLCVQQVFNRERRKTLLDMRRLWRWSSTTWFYLLRCLPALVSSEMPWEMSCTKVNLLVLQRLQEIAIQMSCLEDKTALFIFEICPSHIPLYTCTPVCRRTSLLSSTPVCRRASHFVYKKSNYWYWQSLGYDLFWLFV